MLTMHRDHFSEYISLYTQVTPGKRIFKRAQRVHGRGQRAHDVHGRSLPVARLLLLFTSVATYMN